MRAWVVEIQMSDNYEITTGPFAGVTLDAAKLQPWRYASGQTVVINGREMVEWPVEYLTPFYLSVFDPMLGWSIVTHLEVMEGLQLPDYSNPMVHDGQTVKNSFGADVPNMLQVIKVSVSLLDPTDKLIHTATVLQGINNLNSAELGVKRAMLQLYRGTGLPSAPDGSYIPAFEAAPATQPRATTADHGVTATGSLSQIRPVSVSRSQHEGEEPDDGAAEDDNPLGPPSKGPDVVVAVTELQAAPKQAVQKQPEVEAVKAAPVSDNSHIDPRILNQVIHFATLAGVPVRQLKDDADARRELVSLRKSANKRS